MASDTAARMRETFYLDHCPVETTVAVIGGRWKPFILFHLRREPTRFNELRRLVPKVTQRMLTLHLRELEADGIVSRTVEAVVPPRVTYALTDHGRTLLPVLDAMAAWGMAADTRAGLSVDARGVDGRGADTEAFAAA